MPILQFISDTTTLVSVLLVALVLMISIIKKSKKLRKKFLILTMALVMVALVSQGMKYFFERERPFKTYPFIEKLSEGGNASFPSGHTMEAFALATSVFLLFPRKRTSLTIFLWALLVAYSRMALGVHYPSDVLAGILVGCGIGWMIPWVFNRSSGINSGKSDPAS